MFFFKKKIIDEDLFCNYIRSNKQNKLIKLIKKKKVDINKLDLNWNYISEKDNLSINFIEYFKNFISFNKLSYNKYLTTNHIYRFAHSLDWIILSKTYNFSLHELVVFDKYIRWDYIFFYNNNSSNEYKIFFKEKMWWLFLEDNLSIDVNKQYHILNNKILNKNSKEYPEELIETFNIKLEEYKNNLNLLKLILKKQLFKLYDNYEKNEEIIKLKTINVSDLYDEIKKDLQINTINKYEVKIQTDEKETFDKSIQTTMEYEKIELIDVEYEDLQKDKKLLYVTPSPSKKIIEEEESYTVSIKLEDDICGNN